MRVLVGQAALALATVQHQSHKAMINGNSATKHSQVNVVPLLYQLNTPLIKMPLEVKTNLKLAKKSPGLPSQVDSHCLEPHWAV